MGIPHFSGHGKCPNTLVLKSTAMDDLDYAPVYSRLG